MRLGIICYLFDSEACRFEIVCSYLESTEGGLTTVVLGNNSIQKILQPTRRALRSISRGHSVGMGDFSYLFSISDNICLTIWGLCDVYLACIRFLKVFEEKYGIHFTEL